ncbi:MAG: dihydropteroate synthase [Bacteroidales bacterium]|jgi:dihydropteroate synthase|nr:dihydropteroate synthase [Bacteroidales bacterium]
MGKRITLNCSGKLLSLEKPAVMGILNVTDDSFYDGGRYRSEEEIVSRCEAILEEGAEIIDVGAVSTRPGTEGIDAVAEERKLEDALRVIRKRFPDATLSLDTYRADIARRMVNDYGVDIINDISAGTMDEKMFETVACLNVPYVLMHMQGTPATMQVNPVYGDPSGEVIRFFSDAIFRLRSLGVKDIIVDPGFGFGKTVEHNYELLRSMHRLDIFECPVLAGVSRKSMICKCIETDAHHALNGTTAVNTLALLNGADILRVHDVREAVECIKIVEMYRNGSKS